MPTQRIFSQDDRHYRSPVIVFLYFNFHVVTWFGALCWTKDMLAEWRLRYDRQPTSFNATE